MFINCSVAHCQLNGFCTRIDKRRRRSDCACMVKTIANYSYASPSPGTYVLRLASSTTIIRPSASFRRAKLAERGQEALLNLAQRLNVNTVDIQLVTQDNLDSVVSTPFTLFSKISCRKLTSVCQERLSAFGLYTVPNEGSFATGLVNACMVLP